MAVRRAAYGWLVLLILVLTSMTLLPRWVTAAPAPTVAEMDHGNAAMTAACVYDGWTQHRSADGGSGATVTVATTVRSRSAPIAGRSGVVSAPRFAAEAGSGAANAANGMRLGQQLARESAESVFTRSGSLHDEVIQNSSRIIPGSNIGNPGVVKGLTADGSNIADWGKYTSQTFHSPSGPFQVHYYFNPATGRVNYDFDYKVVFNGAR